MTETVTVLYSGELPSEKAEYIKEHFSKFGVQVNLVSREEYYTENRFTLTFDKAWIDEAYTVCAQQTNENLNKPHGPQPKGKKGKVRKW